MLHKKVLLGFAMLTAGLLLLSGCTAGSTGSAHDPIVGKWAFRGQAAKTDNPATASFTLPSGTATQTQELRADGTYISPRGEARTWKRIDANTVELATVRVVVVTKGNDLYETLGVKTLHWVRTQ